MSERKEGTSSEAAETEMWTVVKLRLKEGSGDDDDIVSLNCKKKIIYALCLSDGDDEIPASSVFFKRLGWVGVEVEEEYRMPLDGLKDLMPDITLVYSTQPNSPHSLFEKLPDNVKDLLRYRPVFYETGLMPQEEMRDVDDERDRHQELWSKFSQEQDEHVSIPTLAKKYNWSTLQIYVFLDYFLKKTQQRKLLQGVLFSDLTGDMLDDAVMRSESLIEGLQKAGVANIPGAISTILFALGIEDGTLERKRPKRGAELFSKTTYKLASLSFDGNLSGIERGSIFNVPSYTPISTERRSLNNFEMYAREGVKLLWQDVDFFLNTCTVGSMQKFHVQGSPGIGKTQAMWVKVLSCVISGECQGALYVRRIEDGGSIKYRCAAMTLKKKDGETCIECEYVELADDSHVLHLKAELFEKLEGVERKKVWLVLDGVRDRNDMNISTLQDRFGKLFKLTSGSFQIKWNELKEDDNGDMYTAMNPWTPMELMDYITRSESDTFKCYFGKDGYTRFKELGSEKSVEGIIESVEKDAESLDEGVQWFMECYAWYGGKIRLWIVGMEAFFRKNLQEITSVDKKEVPDRYAEIYHPRLEAPEQLSEQWHYDTRAYNSTAEVKVPLHLFKHLLFHKRLQTIMKRLYGPCVKHAVWRGLDYEASIARMIQSGQLKANKFSEDDKGDVKISRSPMKWEGKLLTYPILDKDTVLFREMSGVSVQFFFIPTNPYQKCFDFVHVGEKDSIVVVTFFQATVAKSHSVKPSAMREFLEDIFDCKLNLQTTREQTLADEVWGTMPGMEQPRKFKINVVFAILTNNTEQVGLNWETEFSLCTTEQFHLKFPNNF
eukprot:m.233806 g.233806  ORF g.233806 m.233806 type:complete len:833 (+) comp13910_c1_seq15:51-2549(+)